MSGKLENTIYRAHVVIDGAFYRAATSYYKLGSGLGWLNPDSLLDLLQEEVATYLGLSNPDYVDITASYYDGQSSKGGERISHRKLEEAQVKLNLTPLVKKKVGGVCKFIQRGVQEQLICDTLSAAFRDQYDVLVLISGSSSFVPLVNAIKSTRKIVLVAYFDIQEWTDERGRRYNPTSASADLLNSANDEISLSDIIASEPIKEEETNWRVELFLD